MSDPVLAAPDAAADARWLAWKARGVASDRFSAIVMGWALAGFIALAVGWLAVQVL